MRDLRLFGFDPPLRASALPSLVACPWRALMLYTGMIKDEGGVAAQTGSMVHAAVEAWHNNGQDSGAALAAAAARLTEFPAADVNEVRLHFTPYSTDPRNTQAEIVCIERGVEFELPPHEEDKTGWPIRIKGTLDQIRRVDGRLLLFDLKTGRPPGWDMLNSYSYQIAAYTVGAGIALGEPVYPGAIIRTNGYRVRGVNLPSPDGVFFWAPWSVEECYLMLDHVRLVVAKLRAGKPWIGPGAHCSWCPAGGISDCLPELRKVCA